MALLSMVARGAGVVALSALAAMPAGAASTSSCRDTLVHDENGNLVSQVDLNAPTILAGLRARGIDAIDVVGWGGCARADVRQPDGRTKFEYFDPDTLQRLTPG
jgi:hypothetical protein